MPIVRVGATSLHRDESLARARVIDIIASNRIKEKFFRSAVFWW